MSISARYVHTNLVARDWRRLAAFYVDALGRARPCRLSATSRARGLTLPPA